MLVVCTRIQDQIVKGFEITLETMKEVEGLLTSDFIKGLSEEGDHVIVKMLLTFVHSIPNGTENGEFLALDLGGSNCRVWKISELIQEEPEVILSSYSAYQQFIIT